MDLKILADHSDDHFIGELAHSVGEYNALRQQLDEQNVQREHRERVLEDAKQSIIDRFEGRRREELQRTTGEIEQIREAYLKKMERPAEIQGRLAQLQIKYSSLPDENIDLIAHNYVLAQSDLVDRVEITHLVGELERRGSRELAQFRAAVQRHHGMEPWLALRPDLPERKRALEAVKYGEIPVKIKGSKGQGSFMHLSIGDYLP